MRRFSVVYHCPACRLRIAIEIPAEADAIGPHYPSLDALAAGVHFTVTPMCQRQMQTTCGIAEAVA